MTLIVSGYAKRTESNNIDNITATPSGQRLSAQLSACMKAVAQDRDKNAFATIFKHFAPKISRLASQKLGTEAAGLDVTQETMSRVWRKAHMYNPERGAATTWIYTVMRNVIFDQLRKQSGNHIESLSDDIWPLEQVLQTEDDFEDHLMSRRLNHLVEKLPTNQKEVLKAVYYQQLTHEQLAAQLNLPIGTVKSRIRLAVNKLKQQLGERDD